MGGLRILSRWKRAETWLAGPNPSLYQASKAAGAYRDHVTMAGDRIVRMQEEEGSRVFGVTSVDANAQTSLRHHLDAST